MERPSKLVDLTLVSKYYPVANYSYPRKNSTVSHHSRYSGQEEIRNERESLGSEASAPGLIDDRTDSEVSNDDDYQYHAHTAELWDSFWPHGRSSENAAAAATKAADEPLLLPGKQYPALIPSPHRKKQQQLRSGRQQSPPAWPLPNGSPPRSPPGEPRTRKPAATYSAFPKPKPQRSMPPPPRKTPTPTFQKPANPQVQAQAQEEPRQQPEKAQRERYQAHHRGFSADGKPIRPPRPAAALLTPCIQQPAFVPTTFATSDFIIHKNDDLRPTSPQDDPRPLTSHESRRPTQSFDESRCTIYSVASLSTTHLPLPETKPSPTRTPRHHKSLAALKCTSKGLEPELMPEPHSVFEDDSDNEDDHGKTFFSFHRRTESDHRRRRIRANTSPTSPTEEQQPPSRPETPGQSSKRHGHDVFGKLLGRRSR